MQAGPSPSPSIQNVTNKTRNQGYTAKYSNRKRNFQLTELEKIRLRINKAHVELAMLSMKARGSMNWSSEASSTFPKSSLSYIC